MRDEHASLQTFNFKQQLDLPQMAELNYPSLLNTSRQLSQNPVAVDPELFKKYDVSSIVNQKPSNE